MPIALRAPVQGHARHFGHQGNVGLDLHRSIWDIAAVAAATD